MAYVREWAGYVVGAFTVIGPHFKHDRYRWWVLQCAEGHIRLLRSQTVMTTLGVCSECRAVLVAEQKTLRLAWDSLRTRCGNPNTKSFHRYGGRGIKVCERWNEFSNFWEDMRPTWKPGLSIDRKNNDGNYEPDNCRWATRHEQRVNTSRPNFKAQFQQIADSQQLGLRAIYSRYYRGQPLVRESTDIGHS